MLVRWCYSDVHDQAAAGQLMGVAFSSAEFAPPLVSGGFPPLPLGRAGDGRTEQSVLHWGGSCAD